MIRQMHSDSHGSYGLPCVHAHSKLELGEEVNDEHRRDAGLHGVHRRKPVDQGSREHPTEDGKA